MVLWLRRGKGRESCVMGCLLFCTFSNLTIRVNFIYSRNDGIISCCICVCLSLCMCLCVYVCGYNPFSLQGAVWSCCTYSRSWQQQQQQDQSWSGRSGFDGIGPSIISSPSSIRKSSSGRQAQVREALLLRWWRLGRWRRRSFSSPTCVVCRVLI